MRKETTKILDRNGGMHSQPAYRRARAMLDGHGFVRPRLYHLVLLDELAEMPQPALRYQRAIKSLCTKLRGKGIATRWRACLERDDAKGLHCHLFILVEATVKNPCSIINSKPDGWLRSMLKKRLMGLHLSQPKQDMHRIGGTVLGKRKNYATLAGPKFDDCVEWISYLVKRRSKPDDLRNIYFSSRDSRSTPDPRALDQLDSHDDDMGG